MGLRAYLLVNVTDDIAHADLIRALRELENTPGVDFVDRVIGSHDVVVMVDAPVTVEALAQKIRNSPWVKDLEIMRIVNLYERHTGSKMRLLKSLVHSGN
ncbi:MAG TPA: hypothetical protein VLH15_11585 [Dehalococcoidales bacterium]|nr:hypothetical protein [Dehalococcoidales bacterium]